MNDKNKRTKAKWHLPGIGLVLGTAIGAGFGIAIDINMMPVTAGIGCAVGLILGAILETHSRK